MTDYTERAWLGHVTRASMTQIMNLLHLAPDIREALVFLPAVENGRDPVPRRPGSGPDPAHRRASRPYWPGAPELGRRGIST